MSIQADDTRFQLTSLLHAGHDALMCGDWEKAYTAFQDVLKQQETPEALEGLSWACWWLGDATALFDARERVYHLYRQNGDLRGAARTAIWIASDYVDFRGELAIANGWRRRAQRLLEELDSVPEHGWLLIHEGAIAVEIENDTRTAKRRGAEAAALGRRLGVMDLEAIGLAIRGLALISEGAVDEGTSLLDEAMVAAVGGELEEPFSIGWVTCYLICACERMRDFERAAQWCQKMEVLAQRLRFRFWSGICRAHYAGVLMWRGKWQEAEAELEDATQDLQASRPPYTAEAIVRLAELRRRQGRLEEAAELFAQAQGHLLALLGSAEIALERGDPQEAEALLQRFLRQMPEENVVLRAPAFELLVRTYVALGNDVQAAARLESLRSVATTVRVQLLLASATLAEGVVAVAAADYQTACYRFEDAVDLFHRNSAPYEAGRARIELANVLYALGRMEAAQRTAWSARDALQGIGALREAGRAAALLQQLTTATQGPAARSTPVTPREVEVLRLVAEGLSDKEIAARLNISDHTVHRHISNILTKLDVPSRAAAVALAAKQSLL